VPPSSNDQYGIPFPGTFYVDPSGAVTSRVFESAYQERDTIASVMVRQGRGFATAGTKVSASHLELTTWLTDQIVAPGTHFSLVVDAIPAKRVHVYARGVAGYKPIALRLESQPGVIVRGTQWPSDEDFYFRPLNEHVPVYQKPFRVVQDVAIDASAEGLRALSGRDSVTIRGTFDYQACDDKVCFVPQAVPLSWTVRLKALDRERPGKQ
jgi:hypothetical protein